MRPLRIDWPNLFVITHHNITARKLAEQKIDQLSQTDQLTGLYNRRQFDEFLSTEWRRAIRTKSPISIVMFDIDNFKNCNDNYGHPAGDKCLRKVAATLRKFARRPTDFVARFGGDEFVLILCNVESYEAVKMAESIRQTVNRLKIKASPEHFISISAGVATMIPATKIKLSELVRYADMALYSAKNMGRNQVVLAG
jgi:diguanylate cyclase (GGDEF)-like protein